MRLKSYFAGTVESAICLARQEMGEDAMLVNSRKTTIDARHLGAYEVVFAAAQDPVIESSSPARPTVPKALRIEERGAPAATLAQEMAEMRRQLAKVSIQVSRSTARTGRRSLGSSNPSIDDLDEALIEHDVNGDIACALIRNLEALPAEATAGQVRQAFRQDLQERLAILPELSPWSFETSGAGASPARTVAALIGPPGAGKTAMLAKLAVKFGVAPKRSTHIISYDSHRIGCFDTLRSYAAILGVGFEALDTVSALAQSLKENSRKDLILIDTPGYSEEDFNQSSELRKFLATYPHVDIHLVLSCAAKSSDLVRMVDRFSAFNPAKLLFTRIDETSSYGAILNESVRTGLPVSFLGTGAGIPDDLEPATKDRIIDLLLEGRESRAVATA
jgi:flagellar biosynthesis protein FlhF